MTTPTDKDICFAIIQTHFMVGDISANAQKIKTLALDAKARGADVVVFSELALSGCPLKDIVHRPSLPERIKLAITTLADELKDIVTIVGYPHIDHHGVFNSVAILQGGSQKGFYHKQTGKNAPFDHGNNQVLFDYKGVTIGLLVSNDVNDETVARLKSSKADVIVCLNASVFETDGNAKNKAHLSELAKKHNLPIIYTNTVGGQDELVFDGGSMVIGADGKVCHEAPRFLSQILLTKFDVVNKTFDQQKKPALQLSAESEMYQALVVGLRDYVNRSGFKGVIVGLSGGIDSALTLCLAVDALGANKVYAVMMPYQYTSAISLEDAESQAKRLNVSYTVCPIHDAVAGFRLALSPLFSGGETIDTTEENIQARVRGTILMALSNKFGHMVVNTSNKSECAVGYGTLYGDMVGGYGALKDVYKTDVYRLAQYRNRLEDEPVIPERVILRAPSAELRPDQKDQDSLPDYETLDAILRLYIEGNKSFKDIVKAGFDESTVEQVMRLVDINEYKRRQAPIGTKISHAPFGERLFPLVHNWQARW